MARWDSIVFDRAEEVKEWLENIEDDRAESAKVVWMDKYQHYVILTKKQMHDFASTKDKGLPYRVKAKRKLRSKR